MYACIYIYTYTYCIEMSFMFSYNISYLQYNIYIDVSWWFLCLHIDREEDFTACLRSALPTPAKRFQAHKVDPICRMKVDPNGIGYPGGLVNLVQMQWDITILLKVMMKKKHGGIILNLSAHLNVWWMCGRCLWLAVEWRCCFLLLTSYTFGVDQISIA